MALRSFAAAASFAAATAADLQCVGRLAHEVEYSEHEGDWVAVNPAPSRDHECASMLGLGDADRHICVGLNHDETCRAAKNPSFPLPLHAHCQGCFVGASTDVFYHLNITRFHVESLGMGVRGTTTMSTVSLSDDEGWAGKPRTGSKTILEKPIEFNLKLGKLDLDVKLEMPTRLYYEASARENAHGDLGATVELDMGDNYVMYTKGAGWVHHKDKPSWHVKPVHEGDYDALANLTLGFESSLRVELGKLAWFHLDVANEVPVGLTSVGASGADDMHSCMDLGLKLDVTHEAEIDFSFFGHNFTKHMGPVTDRHHDGNVFHKCKDMHPHPPVIVV